MANEVLGYGQCPLCKSEYSQEVRLSSAGKPYMNCDDCGCQIFARQPLSVKLMRGLVEPEKTAAPGRVEPSPEEVEQAKLRQQALMQAEAQKAAQTANSPRSLGGSTFFG